MSANINGLISSTDVWRNGSYDSALYLRKGEEDIITSPLNIISQGLSETLAIEVDNTGACGIVGPVKDIMNVDASGTSIVMGDATNTETFLKVTGVSGESQVFDPLYNPVVTVGDYPLPFPNPGQRGTNDTRPVLYDTVTKASKYPALPLMRMITITTPSTVGSRTTIVDASGNTFLGTEWTALQVGFKNDSGDRTYNCWCEINSGSGLWQVAYDQAGAGNGNVAILMLSNAMFIAGSVFTS